jgi:hypothetical protein
MIYIGHKETHPARIGREYKKTIHHKKQNRPYKGQRGKTMKYIVIGGFIGILTVFLTQGCEPDVMVTVGDNIVASAECGLMYTADPNKTTRGDFQYLLQKTRTECSQPEGTVKNHRHTEGKDKGALKHAVLVDDICIINWELSHVAAMAAFEDVCINQIREEIQ